MDNWLNEKCRNAGWEAVAIIKAKGDYFYGNETVQQLVTAKGFYPSPGVPGGGGGGATPPSPLFQPEQLHM